MDFRSEGPPLFSDQSQGLDDRPPPLSEGLDPPLELTDRTDHFENKIGFFKSYPLLASLKHELM